MRTLVAMATYSFNRLIMGKVEIGNFISTEMFVEWFSTVVRLLSDSLNLIGCRGNIKSVFSKKKHVSQE